MSGTAVTGEEVRGGDDPNHGLTEKLAAVLVGEMPKARGLRVDELARTSTGTSRENWVFVARWQQDGKTCSRRMILRRDSVGGLLRTDREREFKVLRALEETMVPAPSVLWLDAEGKVFGGPAMIMEAIEGSCEWFVLNGPRPLEQRLQLAHRFIEVMAEIQRVDWQAADFPNLSSADQNPADAELAHWESELRRIQLEPNPELELVLNWLRERAPVAQDRVLVHGDFKPGNALLLNGDISAMLDWETAHIGDPLEDLGWITNPTRAREHQIPGVWQREQIVQAYSAATGRKVDEHELLWWNVFSCWKLSVIVLTGVHGFVHGEINRIYQSPVWMFQQMFTLMRKAA